MNIQVEVNKIIPKRFVYEAPGMTSALEFNKTVCIDRTLYNTLTAMKIDTDNADRPESSLRLDYKRFTQLLPEINRILKDLRIAITTSSTVSDNPNVYADAMVPYILNRV